MVRLNTPLYTAQLPQENTYEALPEGKYIAIISKADIKNTKDNSGQYLNLMFTIIDGQFKEKTFFERITISNVSQKAVDFGLSRLNTLLSIGGVQVLEDTEQLKNITVLAVIGFAKELYNGQKQNTVLRFESPQAQMQSQPAYQQPQAQQPIAPQQQQYQAQQTWQQPQQQAQPMQWGQPQAQPQAPTIQSTQDALNDFIPF